MSGSDVGGKKEPVGLLWCGMEVLVVTFAALYCFFYQRATPSDLIVFSLGSVWLLLVGDRLRIPRIVSQEKWLLHDKMLAGVTVVGVLGLWTYGFTKGHFTGKECVRALVITLLYLPYAWLQHNLAQSYLAVRLCRPLAKGSSLGTALILGLVFALLHWPYPNLVLPTFFIGALYCYYFLETGRLWAVALSHGTLAGGLFSWVVRENPFSEFNSIFRPILGDAF